MREGWTSQFAEKEKGNEKKKSEERRLNLKNNEKEFKKIKSKNLDNKKSKNEKCEDGLREKEKINIKEKNISGNVPCTSAQDIYSNQLSRLMFMAEEVMSRK